MISIIPKPEPSVADLKYLRSISTLSLGEIKSAAVNQTSIRDFHIFKSSEWDSERHELATLSKQLLHQDRVPFRIKETNEYGLDRFLDQNSFHARLQYWRGIELEQAIITELELGEIHDPSEYVVDPEDDWLNLPAE